MGEGPASKDAPMIRTGESRPSAPTLVRFNKVSDSSLNLLWSQPSQPNGRITGYEIRYRRFDQPEAQVSCDCPVIIHFLLGDHNRCSTNLE